MEEDEIRDFLVQNPDYFQKNPELLSLLHIPHASGAAVSLVERQVSVLRERNVDLRHRLRDLGGNARDNDRLFADTRSMVLSLLGAGTLGELEQALLSMLRDTFDVELASLILFTEAFPGHGSGVRAPQDPTLARFNSLLGGAGAGCGPLRSEEFSFLFPGADSVGSAALALIDNQGQGLGVLAVGSSDSGHYGRDMGTLFLEFTAEVLARVLPRLGPV